MSTTTIPVAFWLLPSATDASSLQARIIGLSQQNGTVSFEPHVTLHVDTCASDADLVCLMRTVAAAGSPLTLTARRTHHGAAYFKALYVDFDADAGLASGGPPVAGPLPALRRRLVSELLRVRAGAGDSAAPLPAPEEIERALAGYAFLPHLSLLYGDLPDFSGQQLAERNDMQGRCIRFDAIAAVRPSPGHADLSKVAHWELFGHQRLGLGH